MAICDTCGNDYERSFEVIARGRKYVFDSFECAIHALAPSCSHCGCSIIGHGVDLDGKTFCCHHCATAENTHAVNKTTGSLHLTPIDE